MPVGHPRGPARQSRVVADGDFSIAEEIGPVGQGSSPWPATPGVTEWHCGVPGTGNPSQQAAMSHSARQTPMVGCERPVPVVTNGGRMLFLKPE